MEQLTREQKFGRILAIASILGDRLGIQITKHLGDMGNNPRKTLGRLHFDLMQHANRFREEEVVLHDMMGEVIASLDAESDFTTDPLRPNYLQAYGATRHEINNVMGTAEASELWGLAQDYIKRLCREGEVKAYKVGRDWRISRNQPNPRKRKGNEKEPE